MADLGQVFTKGSVAQYMVSLLDLPKDAQVLDPCCGSGAFLAALAQCGFTHVTACELDAALCAAAKQRFGQYQLHQTDFLAWAGGGAFDGIVMNPPYVRQEKIDDLASYGITKAKLHTDMVLAALPHQANLYMYFIMKAVSRLKDGGQLVVIFPNSWMHARTGAAFERLLFAQCGAVEQIHISGDVFERQALVEVVILKLIKGQRGNLAQPVFLESKEGQLRPVPAGAQTGFTAFSYPFAELADIRRGLMTGCNALYINPPLPEKDAGLRPILSSPKSVKGYTTRGAQLDRLLCPADGAVSAAAAEYLERWRQKILRDKKPKTLYEKAKRGSAWYVLRENGGAGILFSYLVRREMKFVMNEAGVLARDNFYIITPKVDAWVLFALLNSTYTYYQLELRGKRPGAGLLKLQRYDLEALMFPDYSGITQDDRQTLARLGRELADTGNTALVTEITNVVAQYCTVGGQEIAAQYAAARARRLEI